MVTFPAKTFFQSLGVQVVGLSILHLGFSVCDGRFLMCRTSLRVYPASANSAVPLYGIAKDALSPPNQLQEYPGRHTSCGPWRRYREGKRSHPRNRNELCRLSRQCYVVAEYEQLENAASPSKVSYVPFRVSPWLGYHITRGCHLNTVG
jgi:hypothetical protein